MPQALTAEIAGRFASIALGHVNREYPNKLDHVMTGPQDIRSPRELHPVFFGSFDWHSCVHGHWLLARLYRRFPQLPQAAAIRALIDGQLTPEKAAAEVKYLEQPATRGFERPYGWAWALALQAELLRHESAESRRWAVAWEPSQDEFLSPALMEAALMADVMPKEDFAVWLAAFLPRAAHGEPATLFTPATVTDRADGKIAHLDGLNLSRAWCWRRIVADLPAADPLRARAEETIDSHIASGLGHVAGDYMGEHWLATFAALALDPD